jgi:tetratricopeptide (TPR) repeat protein
VLPVFERLDDIRLKAVAQGNIANILGAQGQLDEALRIRRDEVLPVYERLGDVWSKAVAQGEIADILFAQGQHDEALRIWREEALPVYEQLGDARSLQAGLANYAQMLLSEPTPDRIEEARACLRRSQTIADRLALPFPDDFRELLAKLSAV